jgi:hypothetical protein
MIFAQVRKDQIMKGGALPKPTTMNKKRVVNKTTLKLPVDKLKSTSKSTPKSTQKITDAKKEKEEPKEESKTSLFGQIKKALQNVPEKLKEILSFGDAASTDKEKPKRSSSITEITSDSKRLPPSKPVTQRSSSAGDAKKCTKAHSLKHRPPAGLDLHKHNLRVDSTLGNILLTKPKQEAKIEVNGEPAKMPDKIAKLGSQQRRPISWRSSHELDKINTTKQQISSLPKLPQIPAIKNADNKNMQQPAISNAHLVPIPKQKQVFDPTGNPYRSAGRKYSPIPAAGWPPARSFNPEVGRCKIIDFIEQVSMKKLHYIFDFRTGNTKSPN